MSTEEIDVHLAALSSAFADYLRLANEHKHTPEQGLAMIAVVRRCNLALESLYALGKVIWRDYHWDKEQQRFVLSARE
jgi:hypothetical protein